MANLITLKFDWFPGGVNMSQTKEENSNSCALPFFLESVAGRIFCLHYPAKIKSSIHVGIVLIPPFTEEMNKSRRTYTLLAHRLSALGFDVLIFDLYGTGDSEGDFSEARLEIWKDNVASCIEYMKQNGAKKIGILGLRFGALLGLYCAKELSDEFDIAVLWQPVTSGNVMMKQFLRLRFAANLMEDTQNKETKREMSDLLENDQTFEVAGYELSLALFKSLDVLRLQTLLTSAIKRVHWIELVTEEGRDFLPANKQVLNSWHQQGLNVTTDRVVGVPFWSSQEIFVVPKLIDATVNVFCNQWITE